MRLITAADLVSVDRIVIQRAGPTFAQYLITLAEFLNYVVVDAAAASETYAVGLSGAGTTQGAATLLAANKNIATTVTASNNAFRMPAGNSPLLHVTFFNDDAADNAQLFPEVGEDIGAGVNLPFLIAPGDWVRFEHKSATTWYHAAGTVSI